MRVVRRGLSCDECGGTEFEKDDSGFFTCISCGVQRTEAEEKQEFDDVATGSRRKLQLLRLPSAHKQETHPFQLTLHDSRLLLETFHYLLHAQCDALLGAFQLTPHVVSTVGRLWVHYVRWWQREGWGATADGMVVFKVGPGIKVGQTRRKVREEEREWQQAKADTTIAGAEQRRQAKDEQQAGDVDSKEQSTAGPWRPLDVAELSLPLSLAILYVALQSCRSPLTMHQLVSLARINRLPYLNFIQPATLPPRLHTLLTSAPSVRSFYRPSVLPATPTLLVLAQHVAAVVGLVDEGAVGKSRRGLSAAAAFGLHDRLFHVSGCVRAYMRQLHVPAALYGLCMAMTRVYTAVMEQKRDKRWTRVRRQRRAERKIQACEDDEERGDEKAGEEQQADGEVGGTSGGHDEWSVMVCVVAVLKIVYGLDRVADEQAQQQNDEKDAEAREEDESIQQAQDESEEGNDQGEADSSEQEERESEAEDAGWLSEATREQRRVNVAERWQTEQEEMEEYEMLQQLFREEEEERQRKEQAKTELEDHCDTLLQMLAEDCSPPPSTALDADLVRLFNPSTHFPSSLYEARHMRPDQQEDMLRLWDSAILPPSLSIDDYGEYLDKMKALHPPPDTASDPASAPSNKPSLASLWRHLSTSLTRSHHATYRQYSRSSQHASQPLHADYALTLHCAALLCGLSADGLHRRLLWWAEQLWRWTGRSRYHSVGWRVEPRDVRLRKERERRRRSRKRKREQLMGRREAQEPDEDGGQYGQDDEERDDEEEEEAQAEGEEDVNEEQVDESQESEEGDNQRDEGGTDDGTGDEDVAAMEEEDVT